MPPRPSSSFAHRSVFRAGDFRWVSYQLLPRPVTCDPATRYWVYLGVDPATVPPPEGARLDTFAEGYAVATLPAAP